MCIEGRTLFVADAAVGAIKMITPTNSLCEFLGQLDLLCKSFGIHLKECKARLMLLMKQLLP